MPRKSASAPIGSSSGATPGAEPVAQLVEGALEAGPLPVELVDEDHPGHAEPGRLPPDRLGLHLHAVDGAHHEHGQVDDPQRGAHVAQEVGVARGVDQVDLVALPLERGHGERQRDPAPLLLGVVVADGGAVLDPPEAVDGAGSVQERLGQRRLAGAAVAHQGHVADLLGRKELHSVPPRCRWLRVQGRVVRGPTLRSWWPRARSACPTAAPSPTTTSAIPAGSPVVYLHGTPDSRLGRPPDDVDRGRGRPAARGRPARAGDSDPDPGATLASLGDDLAALLDAPRPGAGRSCSAGPAAGWPPWARPASSGSAARRRRAGGPAAARRGLRRPDAGRRARRRARAFAELAAGVPPTEVAAEVVPYLVPDPLTAERPASTCSSGRGSGPRRAGRVPGARRGAGRGAAWPACGRARRAGRRTWPTSSSRASTSSAIACPVRTFHGAEDGISPPEVGRVARGPAAPTRSSTCPGCRPPPALPPVAGHPAGRCRDDAGI